MAYKDYSGDDDSKLWRQATSEFKPLKNQKPRRVATDAQKSGNIKRRIEIKTPNITQHILPPPAQKVKYEILEAGDMSRVDGSIAKKLREGSYPIDATLDLHGRTQDEAFEILRYYIANSTAKCNRWWN